jgi:hypothetical protein
MLGFGISRHFKDKGMDFDFEEFPLTASALKWFDLDVSLEPFLENYEGLFSTAYTEDQAGHLGLDEALRFVLERSFPQGLKKGTPIFSNTDWSAEFMDRQLLFPTWHLLLGWQGKYSLGREDKKEFPFLKTLDANQGMRLLQTNQSYLTDFLFRGLDPQARETAVLKYNLERIVTNNDSSILNSDEFDVDLILSSAGLPDVWETVLKTYITSTSTHADLAAELDMGVRTVTSIFEKATRRVQGVAYLTHETAFATDISDADLRVETIRRYKSHLLGSEPLTEDFFRRDFSRKLKSIWEVIQRNRKTRDTKITAGELRTKHKLSQVLLYFGSAAAFLDVVAPEVKVHRSFNYWTPAKKFSFASKCKDLLRSQGKLYLDSQFVTKNGLIREVVKGLGGVFNANHTLDQLLKKQSWCPKEIQSRRFLAAVGFNKQYDFTVMDIKSIDWDGLIADDWLTDFERREVTELYDSLYGDIESKVPAIHRDGLDKLRVLLQEKYPSQFEKYAPTVSGQLERWNRKKALREEIIEKMNTNTLKRSYFFEDFKIKCEIVVEEITGGIPTSEYASVLTSEHLRVENNFMYQLFCSSAKRLVEFVCDKEVFAENYDRSSLLDSDIEPMDSLCVDEGPGALYFD